MKLFGKRRYVVLAFCLLVIFWSSTFTAMKVGLGYSPPILFAGLRAFVGGLVMVGAAITWDGSPNLRRDWPVFLMLSFLNVVAFFALQTLAVLHLPSGTAAILIYLQPILTGFLAWMMLGEQLSAGKMTGLTLGFFGIVAVSAGSLGDSHEITARGVAFGAASALFWALGTVYFKKVQERVSTLWSVAAPFLGGGIFLTAAGLLTEPVSRVSFAPVFIVSLLYAAIPGTALAWVLWLGLVRAGEASRVAAYIFAVPLSAILMGVVFLDEPLGYPIFIGAVLVVCGIYLVNRTPGEEVRDKV